ncbi:MAG: hypothetical protein RLZZ433_463 [Pseudomonadota bacterium]|jgi:hypothetical protein
MSQNSLLKTGFKPLMWALLSVCLLAAGTLWAYKDKIVLGAEAFLFGYPLVMMETTRVHSQKYIGPENELRRVRLFPDATFKDVVRPNVDTLYTTAFISMKDGPWVFEMPANDERYELMPFMDAWTHVFASPGTRTSGTQGGTYLLVGPKWQGQTPAGMNLLRAPTDMVWLIGRTQTNGPADFDRVHRLQDRLKLYPFSGPSNSASSWQASTQKSAPPVVQMKEMSTREFYERLMQLMVENPAKAEDKAILDRLASHQLEPGKPVQLNAIDTASFALGRWIANRKVTQALQHKTKDGKWSTPPLSLGNYGTDYNIRAVVAMVGLGANLPEDALYPNTSLDVQGQALHGQHRYQLHFDAAQLPPVKAFWSITAYGADEFLIANELKRFALGDRDKLVYNADGSLDIWIQATRPTDAAQAANWLPVKADAPFLLNARLYWPNPEALQGMWQMPAVKRLN